MINQRIMGRTGLKLSELCLGTLNFGWNTGQAAAFEVMDAYHTAGGNFIQASVDAPALSLPSVSPSLSEELTGRWWHSRSIPRGELVLATRLRLRQPASSAVSFATIMQEQCQQSLRRMKTTYIDIAVFEWNDGLLPIRDTLAAFDGLVRSGMVRYIVAANFPTWRIADALSQAYARNQCRMEALQADYSLMTRARFEPEAMALCAAQRSGFFARSPLAGGFLARRHGEGTALSPGRRDWLESRFGNAYGEAALAAVTEVASRRDASAAQVALAWVLRNPWVTSAIIGVRSRAQLHELIDASRLQLTESDLQLLDAATATEAVQIVPAPKRLGSAPLQLAQTG